jgi:hypothetical protein
MGVAGEKWKVLVKWLSWTVLHYGQNTRSYIFTHWCPGLLSHYYVYCGTINVKADFSIHYCRIASMLQLLCSKYHASRPRLGRNRQLML